MQEIDSLSKTFFRYALSVNLGNFLTRTKTKKNNKKTKIFFALHIYMGYIT